MDNPQELARELGLLEEIEHDPDTTQASLADRLGVAVGTVNWHMKRLIAKGYVKVKRAERRKLKYIITPEGIALRARLTMAYIEQSMALYRTVREQAWQILTQAAESGYSRIHIQGDGDIADICRLTCLEHGLEIAGSPDAPDSAVLRISGRDLSLEGSPASGDGRLSGSA